MNKNFTIKKPVGGHPAGSVINIQCDPQGIPLDQYWRNRLKDAEVDNCMTESSMPGGPKIQPPSIEPELPTPERPGKNKNKN